MTVPKGMGDKSSSGGPARSQPCAVLRHHTPAPQPNTFVGLPWGILHITCSAGPATRDITLERLGTLPGFPATGTPWAGSAVQPFDRGPRGSAARHPTPRAIHGAAPGALSLPGCKQSAPLPLLGGMEA